METKTSPSVESEFSAKEKEQRRKLKQMKRVATAMLVVAAIVFVVARVFEEDYGSIGYVRATAEAAMVGALADWFAVTALFKRPLGLPIPHTAIVPERKDEIGVGLSQFVQSNFLTAEVVSKKLESMEMSHRLGLWLREPENARTVINELTSEVTTISEHVGDDASQIVDTLMRDQLGNAPVAPIMARVFDAVMAFLREADDHEGGIGIDVSSELVKRLRTDERLISQGEKLKHELLDHPEFEAWTKDVWLSVRQSVSESAHDVDSVIRRQMEGALVTLANRLLADEKLQRRLDAWIESAVIAVAQAAASEIGDLIAETVQGWDADQLIDRIEPPVGCDLQFIRINGTLVGGLAGFLIFAASEWFF